MALTLCWNWRWEQPLNEYGAHVWANLYWTPPYVCLGKKGVFNWINVVSGMTSSDKLSTVLLCRCGFFVSVRLETNDQPFISKCKSIIYQMQFQKLHSWLHQMIQSRLPYWWLEQRMMKLMNDCVTKVLKIPDQILNSQPDSHRNFSIGRQTCFKAS